MITMFKHVTFLFVFLPVTLFAQRGYTPGYWSLNVLASSSSFLSDLGGKDAIGTNDPSDLDFSRTRYALGAGFMYHNGAIGFEVGSFYTKLAADDNLTSSSRHRRLLNVQTDVFETYAKVQLTFPRKMPVLGNFYVNVGGGFIYYEPRAELNGTMYKLRPLGTEGQNYLAGKAQYGQFAPVIPFGVGKKFDFKNGSSISIDLSMRKSFTDYLDDVSTVYADPAIVAERSGEAAGLLSDRSEQGFNVGDQRGDPTDMDNYFLLGFKYSLPLSKYHNFNTSCAFGNSWVSHRGGGMKFKKRGRMRRGMFR